MYFLSRWRGGLFVWLWNFHFFGGEVDDEQWNHRVRLIAVVEILIILHEIHQQTFKKSRWYFCVRKIANSSETWKFELHDKINSSTTATEQIMWWDGFINNANVPEITHSIPVQSSLELLDSVLMKCISLIFHYELKLFLQKVSSVPFRFLPTSTHNIPTKLCRLNLIRYIFECNVSTFLDLVRLLM